MNDIITVDDLVNCSDFFDLRNYNLCFTADNEPIYVPKDESADRPETAASQELTAYQALKRSVPLWEKTHLTLEEAAAYSGVGIHKLRELTDEKGCKFVLWNGNKRLIKRCLLNEYLTKAYSI